MFEWDEANAKPEAELGYRCATQAVAAATLMFRARELGTDLDFVRRMTARTLAMLDHFDNSVLSGDKTGTNAERNFMLFPRKKPKSLLLRQSVSSLPMLGLQENCESKHEERPWRASRQPKNAQRTGPGTQNSWPIRASRVSCLGTVILLENQYQDAWTALREAQAMLESSDYARRATCPQKPAGVGGRWT